MKPKREGWLDNLNDVLALLHSRVDKERTSADGFGVDLSAAKTLSVVEGMIALIDARVWQPIETAPKGLPIEPAMKPKREECSGAKIKPVHCAGCGRFISYREMENGARFDFTPDSHRSHEVCEWICAACVEKERP